jgi:hypothetical protein
MVRKIKLWLMKAFRVHSPSKIWWMAINEKEDK